MKRTIFLFSALFLMIIYAQPGMLSGMQKDNLSHAQLIELNTLLIAKCLETTKNYKDIQNMLKMGADPDISPQEVTPLQIAVQARDYELMELLLKHKADPNKITAKIAPSIHIAICTGDFQTAELLFKYKANPNICNRTEVNALTYACGIPKPSYEMIKLLLEHKADATAYPILQMLCKKNIHDLTIFKLLLKYKTDLHFCDEKKMIPSPLLAACWAKNPSFEIIQLFLQNGANLHQIVFKKTPMLTAFSSIITALKKEKNIQRKDNLWNILLLFADYTLSATERYMLFSSAIEQKDIQRLKNLLSQGIDPNSSNDNQTTPLIWACSQEKQSISLIKELLLHKANPNFCTIDGITPLYALTLKDSCDPELLQLLIDNNADTNNVTSNGESPLCRICSKKQPNKKAIEILLKAGANPNHGFYPSGIEITPFRMLCNDGYDDLVKLIIHYGGNPNALDCFKKTTLTTILETEKPNSIALRCVLQHGGHFTDKPENNDSPLMTALQNKNIKAAQHLIEYAPELVNTANTKGITPLLRAAQQGLETIVPRLCKKGANINAVNKINGNTPLLYAAISGNQHIVEYLLKKKANPQMLNNLHWSALYGAVLKKNFNLCKLLYFADPAMAGVINTHNKSPKILAFESQFAECSTFFETPLIILAIQENRLDLLEDEINKDKSNINVQDVNYMTPLMVAIITGNDIFIQKILSYKPNLTLVDNEGNSALFYAAKKNMLPLFQMLLKECPEMLLKQNTGQKTVYQCIKGSTLYKNECEKYISKNKSPLQKKPKNKLKKKKNKTPDIQIIGNEFIKQKNIPSPKEQFIKFIPSINESNNLQELCVYPLAKRYYQWYEQEFLNNQKKIIHNNLLVNNQEEKYQKIVNIILLNYKEKYKSTLEKEKNKILTQHIFQQQVLYHQIPKIVINRIIQHGTKNEKLIKHASEFCNEFVFEIEGEMQFKDPLHNPWTYNSQMQHGTYHCTLTKNAKELYHIGFKPKFNTNTQSFPEVIFEEKHIINNENYFGYWSSNQGVRHILYLTKDN